MKNRTRAYYRHQRRRVIEKKLDIVRHLWGKDEADPIPHPFIVNPGKLAKAKLHCSCVMCKYEKHFNISKHTVVSKLAVMQQEVDEYWSEE
ncbi:hypothetical protein [Rossellomorea marisflavi]|uniref:hypothetical protein n=1 Tax=Rossellomorea marisflavi TaxID=189381 RepID=UPI00064E56F4|nr:hypothetical protein [Rossellomorea marisflavi]KML33631.1 hypothetical protein VL12_08130 [Rossellomorea marisflavi]USK93252.1 hypothetical protein LIT29_05750 [Rossellomorea marisflavi]